MPENCHPAAWVSAIQSDTKGNAKGVIERTFTPEFRNRLDAWVPFKALDIEVIKLIVDKFIKELNGQLAEKRVLVKLTEDGSRMAREKRLRRTLRRTADVAAHP